MSLDVNELVRAVKKAALDAVLASKPFAVCYGAVTKSDPLEIQIDQKHILTDAQLILTNNVRDYMVEMTTLPEFHETENASEGSSGTSFPAHKHKYQGCKKWRVHLALKTGETVVLLRCDGGQKYIVLDRKEALS